MRNMRVETNHATRAAATAAAATAVVLYNVESYFVTALTSPKLTAALRPTTATACARLREASLRDA